MSRRGADAPVSFQDPYDPKCLPDFDVDFIGQDDLDAFARALAAPESTPVTALNDWRPIHQHVRRKSKKKRNKRTRDETREGFVYSLLKWPFFIIVLGWIATLSFLYLLTRWYIWAYEHLVNWRGPREQLRQTLRSRNSYPEWIDAARNLDSYLGNDGWKEDDEYAYYDHLMVRKVRSQLRTRLSEAMVSENDRDQRGAIDRLKTLVEACVRSNFAGMENPRLYSETYYGTKHLLQSFIDQIERSLAFLFNSNLLDDSEKLNLARHLHTNLGRTALCLSGGAGFAYYHFGVVKALLDNNLMPSVLSGTSGGALVASLVATRTDEELRSLLVPALASRITACQEGVMEWFPRWWNTGARFDSIDWARKCSWFCRGSMTFLEAYQRTGRVLNVSCIPSDAHSPAILANYLTAPNACIWSAVLASAAVPGILNPIVLMMKNPDGTLEPYSFGHKWKDGSLRTDIPLKALNLHFNVNFSIVSQVNPHINLFFFSPRGTIGRPVTHRKGRGWRGGFLGSAIEKYLVLDLTKWLKVLRALELLPRAGGQDWSNIWLQQTFGGTITIWPRSVASDFYYILSDPSSERLARMIHVGQSSTFPKLLFLGNRMKVERLIDKGLAISGSGIGRPDHGTFEATLPVIPVEESTEESNDEHIDTDIVEERSHRSNGVLEELRRQGGVFFDDYRGQSITPGRGDPKLE